MLCDDNIRQTYLYVAQLWKNIGGHQWSHNSLEKKTIFFFFFVMPLDGCTSDVDSGDINNLFPVLPFSDKSTDILVFNIFEKLWKFFNLVKHCRHMPLLVSNKCIYHPFSLIQQISSMKSIIYLLSLIFGPVTLKRMCGDSLQQTHFGKVVWSSSIIRLKEKNISSLRQGARCWLASGTHIYSPSPYSPFMRKFMYPPPFCTTIIWKYLVGSGKPQKPLWNKK